MPRSWFVLAALISSSAWAAPLTASQAEHRRLADEMQRLAARDAWKGVEAAYLQLLTLEDQPGVELSYYEHMLGAQAARDAGRIADVRDRLRRAQARLATDDVKTWLAEIDRSYAPVDLSVDPGVEPRLLPIQIPLEPDQRAALAYAQGALLLQGSFEGLLPRGAYTLNGQSFTADAAASISVHINQTPASSAPPAPPAPVAANGLRLLLAPAVLRLGAASTSAGVQGNPMGGGGLRASLGGEVALTNHLGAFAEGGYQGLLGGEEGGEAGDPAAPTADPVYEAPRERLHMGWVWAGLSAQAGPVTFSAGPLWMGGRALVYGATIRCAGSDDPSCDDLDLDHLDADLSAEVPAEGTILAGGLGFSAFYPIFAEPVLGATHLGLRVDAGFVTDTDRTAAWTALGVALSPR